MAHRPFTPRQRAQNAAFLEALRRTGNSRLAARELGVHRATYTKRRAKDAAFAQSWEMALAAAHAALKSSPPLHSGTVTSDCPHSPHSLRTKGGEPVVVRLKNGKLQLRLALPGRMTKAAEQLFFRALSASANVRLSAAAAGFAASSFYWRKHRRRAFAREMRLALEMSCDRLEAALLASTLDDEGEDAQWRHNDPPPIPPMTADQALQLLYLHEKSVRQSWDQPHRRKRRGEPWETYTERLRAMWTCEKAREAEDSERRLAAMRRAERWEDEGSWGEASWDCSEGLPELPPLHLVTGWSKAKGKPPHNPDRALFGGWRLKDWEKRKKAKKG